MGSLEQWINKKAKEQEISFQPEYWSEFESYRRQKDNRRRRFAVILFFIIVAGSTFLYTLWPHSYDEEASPMQVREIFSPLKENQPALNKNTVKAEKTEGGGYAIQKTSSGISTLPAKQTFARKKVISQTKTSANSSFHIDFKTPEISAFIPKGGFIENTFSSSELLIGQKGVKNREFLSKLPALPLLVKAKKSEQTTQIPAKTEEDLLSIEPAIIQCCSAGSGLWLQLKNSIVNSQIPSNVPLTGVSLLLEKQMAVSTRWSWAASLGLGVTEGQFGIQLDHPQVSYSFQKREVGFRTIPRLLYTANARLNARYHKNKWSIEAGLILDRVFAVRGEIQSYGDVDQGANSFEGSQWLPKEGFHEWAPGLTFGLNYKLTKTWAFGVTFDTYPNGRLNSNHQSYYNNQTNAYEHHSETSWTDRQSNLQFSIVLSYRL
jgi:hypothetical protein